MERQPQYLPDTVIIIDEGNLFLKDIHEHLSRPENQGKPFLVYNSDGFVQVASEHYHHESWSNLRREVPFNQIEGNKGTRIYF